MAFEVVASQEISSNGEGDAPLTENDLHWSTHVLDRSSLEVAFDPKADPEDPAYTGNYKIIATSKQRNEPHRAILEMYNGIGPWLGRTGDRLRHELLRYPICHSTGELGNSHPLKGLQKALGISATREVTGITTVDTFTLTVGADHLTAAASKVPKECWTYEFTDSPSQGAYSQVDLEAALAGEGSIIVTPVPEDGDGLDIFDRIVYALHDNSMHVQSAAVFGTPEIRDLIKTQFGKLKLGESLDLDTFFGDGPEKMKPVYDRNGLYWLADDFSSPYLGLRKMVLPILAPADRLSLAEEIAAVELGRSFDPNQYSEKELIAAHQIMDRPGNMLDQLDAVAPSIPRRYVALARFSIDRAGQ